MGTFSQKGKNYPAYGILRSCQIRLIQSLEQVKLTP